MSVHWSDGISAATAMTRDDAGRLRLSILRESFAPDSRWGAWVERETPARSWVIVADDGGGYQHATREDAKRVAEWMAEHLEPCTAAQWADVRTCDAIVHRAVDAAIGRQMVSR